MKDSSDDSQGMAYLSSLPRRAVVLYLPLAIFVFVLGAVGALFARVWLQK